MVDAGGETEIEVLFDHLAGDRADILVADAGVVGALRRRIAGLREAERAAVLVEEIFLLEAEPGAVIVEDGCPLVRWVWRLAVRHHDFAHHQHAVLARAVRENADRLEHAVRTLSFRLHGRASVKAPQRKLFEGRKTVVLLDLGFSAKTWDWRVPVEPYVLELIFCHAILSSVDDAKGENPKACWPPAGQLANNRTVPSILYASPHARSTRAGFRCGARRAAQWGCGIAARVVSDQVSDGRSEAPRAVNPASLRGNPRRLRHRG